MKCATKQQLTLWLMLAGTYSLLGAIIEHLATNVHTPLMAKLNPKRYPNTQKLQRNMILTGFPVWTIAGLVLWQANAAIDRRFFPLPSQQRSVAKLLFDFCFWSVIFVLFEWTMSLSKSNKKCADGTLHSYDYSCMKYHYKGHIALPVTLLLGVGAVIFIRVNPKFVNLLRQGIDKTVC